MRSLADFLAVTSMLWEPVLVGLLFARLTLRFFEIYELLEE